MAFADLNGAAMQMPELCRTVLCEEMWGQAKAHQSKFDSSFSFSPQRNQPHPFLHHQEKELTANFHLSHVLLSPLLPLPQNPSPPQPRHPSSVAPSAKPLVPKVKPASSTPLIQDAVLSQTVPGYVRISTRHLLVVGSLGSYARV